VSIPGRRREVWTSRHRIIVISSAPMVVISVFGNYGPFHHEDWRHLGNRILAGDG
jgi:hypothetical protein